MRIKGYLTVNNLMNKNKTKYILFLALMFLLMSYDIFIFVKFDSAQKELATLQESNQTLLANLDISKLNIEEKPWSNGQQNNADTSKEENAMAIDARDILVMMAKESEVEVIDLLQVEETETNSRGITYKVKLKADINRAIGYVNMIENCSFRRFALNKISSRREAGVWDTNIEATVCFGY